jgi:lipid-binding SYLF domain-containing protein
MRVLTHLTCSILLLTFAAASALQAASDAVERQDTAAQVLEEVMGTPEKGIPLDLISKAHCVAVIPGVKKAGLIFAGRYGKGVVSCRGKNNMGWTGPSTVRIEGGSFGLQIGGSSTDFVLLVMNERGAEKLIESKFTLGADAAVAGGPVGRTASAQTDAQMHAQILSYSRSRGAFAGISLDGSTLRPDNDDNKDIYGKAVSPKEILSGDVPVPASSKHLIDTLTKYSSAEH